MIREGTAVKENKHAYLVVYAKSWVWLKLVSLRSTGAWCGEVMHPNGQWNQTNSSTRPGNVCLLKRKPTDSPLFMWCYGASQKPHFSPDLYFVPLSCFPLPRADSGPQ